jgi:hypothetical protein
MRKGMTVIELLVGLATAMILVGVCAKVLQLGIMTYAFSKRQNEALTRTRKAVAGDGANGGILEAGREGYQFASLQASSMTVLAAPGSSATNFFVTGGNLYRTSAGVGSKLADNVYTVAMNYYTSTNGMVSSTTVVASASMVTATVSVGTGTAVASRAYILYTGAQLRNHP